MHVSSVIAVELTVKYFPQFVQLHFFCNVGRSNSLCSSEVGRDTRIPSSYKQIACIPLLFIFATSRADPEAFLLLISEDPEHQVLLALKFRFFDQRTRIFLRSKHNLNRPLETSNHCAKLVHKLGQERKSLEPLQHLLLCKGLNIQSLVYYSVQKQRIMD